MANQFSITGDKMEMLIVKSKIKEMASGFNVGSDVADAMNATAHMMLQMAAKKAEANGRKTVQGKDLIIVEGKLPTEMLVVKSKLKEAVSGYNVGGDLADALNYMLAWVVMQAGKRAELNGRKTIQARDI